MEQQQKRVIKYRCKQCRQQLFSKEDIEHAAETRTDKCTSIFISTEVDWVQKRNEVIEEWDHNLNCPKCSTKIGEIKFDGLKCFCGKWMAPGVQISLGKIDQFFEISK